MKPIITRLALVIILAATLGSCGANRRAEREKRHQEKLNKLDEDKKKFEQQNPGVR